MIKWFYLVVFVSQIQLGLGQSISELIERGENNLENNRWKKAQKNFNELIELHDDELTYSQKGIIYNRLGFLSLTLLDLKQAEKDLKLSLFFHEEGGIQKEQDYADALISLGMIYLEQVEFDLSRQYIQRALKILEKRQEYYIDFLIARTKLARIYEEAASYTLALNIYNDSYEQLISLGNNLSPDFADICSHKGRLLMLTGNLVEGEYFIGLSTAIYESLGSQYNVRRAESMEDLALFYEQMSRYDDAEKLLLEILALKKSMPDEADILIIKTLHDLGIMYISIGRFSKAEEMFDEVVLESEKNVGTYHPFYATAKDNLGIIALSKGDYYKAKVMLKDALKTHRNRFGALHPYYANTLNNLARVERRLGNISVAESYYMEVLQIDRRIFGENHPNYATTMLNIGILLSSAKREIEAEQYYKNALEIRENVLGVNHPSYGNTLLSMGIRYLAMGNLVEAERLLRKSVQIQIHQINVLFPIMTELERELFYIKVKKEIEKYNYIASQLLETNPELIKNIFDFHIKTKTFLFKSLNKIERLVANSDDNLLQVKYHKWVEDKRLLASYYQMGVQELAELNVNLNLLELDIASQEERLKVSIESFDAALINEDLSWKKVLESVKLDESILEIIRIKEFKAVTNTTNENTFGFTKNTQYLAVIFNYGASNPAFQLMRETCTPDQKYYPDYPIDIEKMSKTTPFYNTFWKPLSDKINGKNVRLIPDGYFQ